MAAIDISTFLTNLGVTSIDTTAINQYEFYKGIVWSDASVTNDQYEFYQKLQSDTYRYGFYKTYTNEYVFYTTGSGDGFTDTNIVDFYTFYKFAASGGVTPVETIPNYRSDDWMFDQTTSNSDCPNSGFISPSQYLGETMSVTGLGTWNSGMTFSDMVGVGLPIKNSGASLDGINRMNGAVPYWNAPQACQIPGMYYLASEDNLSSTVQIQSVLFHATQSSTVKAISDNGIYETTSDTYTFDEAFDDTDYSIILPYERDIPNLKNTLDGWYVSSKLTTGFTVQRGNMLSKIPRVGSVINSLGVIAFKSNMDNAYIKNGTFTPAANATGITFSTAFADADYAVFVSFESNITPGTNFIFGVTNVAATGFTLNLSSAFWVATSWTAIKHKYTDSPGGLTI